ncbi:MAG: adk, adenylate kinase, adenylate kinase [Parcubacteria group bacterium]|nr:adk, adenylate kinase, adenylate kinase [Parcubacteria group bacterium]
MTEPKTILLFGKPGSGKDTQLPLIEEYIRTNDATHPVVTFLWAKVRDEFMNGPSFAQKRTRELTSAGELLPKFLAPAIWTYALLDLLHDNEHLIVGGLPRQLMEAELFESLLAFYGRTNVIVINLEISEEDARTRIRERAQKENRADDSAEERIDRRMEWFKTDTLPVLEFFKKSDRYRVIDIDAAGSVEEVSARIAESLT